MSDSENPDFERFSLVQSRSRSINDRLCELSLSPASEENTLEIARLTAQHQRDQLEIDFFRSSLFPAEQPAKPAATAYIQKIRPTAITASDLINKPKLKLNFSDPAFEFAVWFNTFQDACVTHGIPCEESVLQVMNCLDGNAGGENMLRNYLLKDQALLTSWSEVKAAIKGIFPMPENSDGTAKRFLEDKLTSLSDFMAFHNLYLERMAILGAPECAYFVEDFLRRLQVSGLRRAIEEAYDRSCEIARSADKEAPPKTLAYVLSTGLKQIAIILKNKSTQVNSAPPTMTQRVEVPVAKTGATPQKRSDGVPSPRSSTAVAAPDPIRPKPAMSCDFCKPDPGNHSTSRCLSKSYHDRMVRNGADPKSIKIPALATLQEEAKARKLDRLARQLGDSTTGSGGAQANSDRAALAHFSEHTDEDDYYSNCPSCLARRQRAPVPAKTPNCVSTQTDEQAETVCRLETSATDGEPDEPSPEQQSIIENLESKLAQDDDGAFVLSPIAIPTAPVAPSGPPGHDRPPEFRHATTSVSVDEFSEFPIVQLDFSKAYSKNSTLTALEIVHAPSKKIFQLAAPYDTECSRTMFFSWFCDLLGIAYRESQHQVKDFRGVLSNVSFTTTPVTLRHGPCQVQLDKVMVVVAAPPLADDVQQYPMLIGSDIDLGIRVQGVQGAHTSTMISLRKFDDQIFPKTKKMPSVQELRSTEADVAARDKIMALLVENNKKCPEGSLCTLPDAKHTISLVNGGAEKLRHQAQYRLGRDKEAVQDKTLQNLAELGIITRNEGAVPCTHPHVVDSQTQGDGSIKYRLCFAAMALNQVTVPCARTTPLTYLQIPSDYKYFTSIDLSNYYLHFPIAEESQKYLSFVWKKQYWMYTRLIYGLLNAMSHSQSVLESAIAPITTKPSLVEPYVDDVRFADKTLEKHVDQVCRTITKLTEWGFRIKIAKCVINGSRILTVGHIQGPGYVMADPSKLAYIRDFVPPSEVKGVHSFLAFLQYLSKFVLKFSNLVAPLHDAVLLHQKRKDKNFNWTDELLQAFHRIKKVFSAIPHLNSFDVNKVTHVVWDASTRAWGAVLYQYAPGSAITTPTTDNIVAMASKQFNSAEAAGGSYKLEVQAGIRAFLAFNDYLVGRKFKASTDNIAIIWLFSNVKPNRFAMNMMYTYSNYTFETVHISGDKMIKLTPCDFISRAYSNDEDRSRKQVKPVIESVRKASLLLKAQGNKAATKDQVAAPPAATAAATSYVPEPVADISPQKLTKPTTENHAIELIENAHAWGHWGARSIRLRLNLEGWDMHGYSILIDRLVQGCTECQQWTSYVARYAPFRSSQPSKPFDVISFDLATGFLPNKRGYTGLLVVVCNLTKFVFVRPFKEKTTAAIGYLLFSIFIDFGFPQEIQCDNEPVLLSVVKLLKSEARVRHRQTVEYAPRTNSNAETAVKLASSVVHKIVGNSPDWDLLAPICQAMINDRVRADKHKRSPFEAMFCRSHNGFRDSTADPAPPPNASEESFERWMEKLKLEELIERPFMRAYASWKNNQAQEDFESRHHVSKETLPVGSQVMYLDPLRPSKNHPPYLGPFIVESCDDRTGHYTLRDTLNTAKKIRATLDQLKPLPLLPNAAALQAPAPQEQNNDPICHVERLLAHRTIKGGDYEYRVLWKGFDESAATWEKSANILDPALITNYWSSKKRTYNRRQ